MTKTGTEPGDFVEYDMDALEAARRAKLREALEEIKKSLVAELGVSLQVANEGNDFVLADEEGVRFRVAVGASGRLMVTDARAKREFL